MSVQSSTQFRRSGQRDDRRRRLLADESCGALGGWTGSLAGAAGLRPQRRSENYGDAAFIDQSWRLLDLIPRRLSSIAVLLLAGLAVVAGLEALYAWACPPTGGEIAGPGRIAAFDLGGQRSLAVWFCSTVLSLAALAAVLVYTVRRHKVDDYQGYYRIWLWAATCWLLLSIDSAAALHDGFRELMVRVTGTRLFGDGSIWWVAPCFFLLGAVGSRLLVDMRHCRLSSAALLVTAGCCVLAVVVELGWVRPVAEHRAVMVEVGADMVGGVFLLLAMTLHARYVLLDAEGLLPRREAESEEDGDEEESSPGADEWLRVESAHSVAQPVFRRAPAASVPATPPEPVPQPEVAGSPVRRKLTKQERKALRQRLLQQRAEREQRQRRNWP